MKKLLVIAALLLFSISLSLYAQIPDKFIGSWNCVCSQGEVGFQYFTMEIKVDSVFITYNDESYPYASDWVKMESDTLRFSYNVGAEVVIAMYYDDDSNPIGKAWWWEKEAPLILTRTNVKE